MNNKIITVAGAVLIAVIAAQAFYTWNLSKQVDQLSRSPDVQTRQNPSPGTSAPSPQLPQPPNIDPFRDNWNPFEQMQRMQNEMNKIFGDMRSQLQMNPDFGDLNQGFTFAPSVDMQEQDDRFVVTVDIPGADESNINVQLDGNRLQISASTRKTTKQQADKGGGNVLRSERFFGEFKRVVTLPGPVVPEKMQTDYKDGVLTIVVPKA